MKRAIIVAAVVIWAAGTQPGIAQSVTANAQVTKAPEGGAAATAYQLPFASTGNSIELSIANAASLSVSGITVEATAVPSWIQFKETRQTLPILKANQELPILFTFSVDKKAPVGKEESIKFNIVSSTGESWSKEILVSVAPPEHFELFHNYPNPFNPTTTISYQLPADSRVHLKVFDLLGREVATVVDETETAGYYQKTFDATRFSSGMYVYQIVVTDKNGNRQVARKAMMLVK
jgi:hypothetical protein